MGTITGTSSGETLNGTSGDDIINAQGGNDTVDGGDGNDTINGGTGNDALSGGNGNDTFIEDQITSTTDSFDGGAGTDTIELRVVPNPVSLAPGLVSVHPLVGTLTSIERLVFSSQASEIVQASMQLSAVATSGLTDVDAGIGRAILGFNAGSAAGTYTMPTLNYTNWGAVPLNAWDNNDDALSLGSSANSGTTVTLNAAAGLNIFQALSGGNGNDTLNGSSNGDSLNGGAGVNQLFGNGGNDLLVLANTAPATALNPPAWGAPSTLDGLGSTYDGGSGTDVLGIGGVVNLRATLVSIEGIDLLPAFTPPLGNVPKQDPAFLILNSQELAMLPTNVFFLGTATVEINLDDHASLDASQFVINAGSSVSFDLVAGDGDGLTITGTANDDLIQLGSGTQTANGGAGADVILLSDGTQTANGGDGDDLIAFGIGTQTATGGAGSDHFTVAAGSGIVTDFTVGTDKVDLSQTGVTSMSRFNDLTTTQVGANLVLSGDSGGQHFELVLQNVDKASFGASSLVLSPGGVVNNETGTGFTDLLFGYALNDEMHGGAGNDRIYGGGGMDKLYGDDGDDVIILDGAITPGGTFDGGAGTDTLLLRSYDPTNSSYGIFGTVTGFEKLQFDSHAGETIGGNALVQTLTGGMSEIIGGAGKDVLVAVASSGGTYGLQGLTLTNWDSAGGDSLVLVAANVVTASVTLNARSDVGSQALVGAQGDDTLNGSGFVDTLRGNAGNDTLNGGGGADMLFGGTGNDTYTVDTQGDLAFENVGEGTDTVVASTSFYLYENIENLTLASGIGDSYGVGNALDNLMTGNEGTNLMIGWDGNDEIHGGGARDALFGVDGNDHLYGDAGIDYIVAGNGDDYVDGGADEDEIYGQDGNDTLIGGADFKTDILVGGTGNDIIHGDSGLGEMDWLYGNEGDDTFYVDTPFDLVFEQSGEGTDTVIAGITGAGYYLYDNIENLILTGDTPFGVGNALDNHLTGSDSVNWLLGGAGNDTINGKGGDDVLFGEAGADTFVFEAGTGIDVVGDFTAGTDKIDLSAFHLDWTQVQTALHENGGTAYIDLGAGDLVILNGVAMASLHQGDFIL